MHKVMEHNASETEPQDDVTTALNGAFGTSPHSIGTATLNVPTSSCNGLRAEWNDRPAKDHAGGSNEQSNTEPTLLLQILSAPCKGCTSNNVSSSTLSGSTSSLSSLTSEGTSGKSTSHSSSSLTQVPSPSHSPKAAGLKKRRRHKHIPIQYHYIISPDVETVQPPTKQELALKAILDECQVAVECVPNYHSNLDGYSCWDSSPSDTQTSWMGSDSGGVLECPGAVTTPSPYTEANYNSHLYTFPTTSPQYTMFGDGVHGGLLPCNQMEGEFPQQLHHNGVPPHCESVPHCYSASVYATSWPVAPPHSEYQC